MPEDIPLSITVFVSIGVMSIVVMLATLAGAMLWPFDDRRNRRLTRWRQLRAIGLAAGLVAGFLYWSRSYWYDEIDRAVMWGPTPGPNDDISHVMERALPVSLEEAIVVLRKSGFEEGWYGIGAVHHYRRVPEPGEASELKRNWIRSLNSMLEEHNATSVRRFEKRVTRMVFPPAPLFVYLLVKRDGRMIVYAQFRSGIVFL